MNARTCLDTALRWSPAQPLFRWRTARKLTVLAYHTVEVPEQFERHLDFLLRSMHPVSLDEVLDAVAGRRRLPRRAVLITFDDGHRSVFEEARPLLRARGMPAAVFVVAGLLDTATPYWFGEARELVRRGGRVDGITATAPDAVVRAMKKMPDEVRLKALDALRATAASTVPAMPQLKQQELSMLEEAGIAVGNHTLTHPCLDQCTGAKIVEEVELAHEMLIDALGHPPRAFAYPNGDEDPRVVRAVAECGYEAAFLFDHRLSPVPPPNPLRISRARVDASTSLDRLAVIVSGLHPAVHHARGRD